MFKQNRIVELCTVTVGSHSITTMFLTARMQEPRPLLKNQTLVKLSERDFTLENGRIELSD